MGNKTTSWDELREELLKNPEVRKGYDKAERAYQLSVQVRKIREKAGISQSELARRMGTTQPAIARLEAGGGNPNIDTLGKIADALDVELSVTFKRRKAS